MVIRQSVGKKNHHEEVPSFPAVTGVKRLFKVTQFPPRTAKVETFPHKQLGRAHTHSHACSLFLLFLPNQFWSDESRNHSFSSDSFDGVSSATLCLRSLHLPGCQTMSLMPPKLKRIPVTSHLLTLLCNDYSSSSRGVAVTNTYLLYTEYHSRYGKGGGFKRKHTNTKTGDD